MAPGHLPVSRPIQASTHSPQPNPDPRFWPRHDTRHDFWLLQNMKNFAELILWGESQPSTGTARLVERPNGETRFVVAYGSAPDYEIRALLGDIFLKHGAVTLHHDGRDATGKHWFKCYGRGEVTWQYDGRDSSGEHWSICFGTAEPKAIICVSSKFPPKVLGVVEDAPKDLFLLPLSQQLRWLEPDVAQAVRERLETENLSGEFCG